MQKKNGNFYFQSSEYLLKEIRNAMTYAPAIKPAGYARKKETLGRQTRVLNVMWSDQHYGTDLTAADHLRPYSNMEECRATSKILDNVVHYKPNYRDDTRLHMAFLGDDFAGMLGHDDKSLPELQLQMMRAAHIEAQVIAIAAAEFRHVTITRNWGNHGRDTLRHKGRADNYKWINWEFITWELVRAYCRGLENVKWETARRGYSYYRPLGWQFFLTHFDTVLSGKPGSTAFSAQLAAINSSPLYEGINHVVMGGHWHSGETLQVNHTRVLVNGALIPPDGFSQSNGYLSGAGQWLFETTENFAVGDMRFVQLSPSDYTDEKAARLIAPWTQELAFFEVDEEEVDEEE